MRRWVWRWMKRAAALVLAALVTLLAVRVYDTQRGAPLELWHTVLPPELTPAEMDRTDWAGYLAAEDRAFATVRREVTDRLPPPERVRVNRYFDGSLVYPPRFATDWNRSYVLDPQGPPKGAAVFLHGLTDSPYSLRHLARMYQERGFVAVAIRIPAHGTVPGALTAAHWEDWLAATRLAVREARRRAGPDVPLHIVGFSNGGALALMYALDALDDPALVKPQRLVLLSPMIGITAFARFAGLAGLPAVFPAFAKAAWLSILPEFNPFKYNSFPVNGARQSHLLTRALQERIQRYAQAGRLGELPPVLTFQSVLDFTVSTPAVLAALYNRLPANGSELVLFDVNRNATLSPLFNTASETKLDRILPPAPRAYRTTVVGNPEAGAREVSEHVVEAGTTAENVHPLGLAYPAGVYSLSHVALPFPLGDGLYGLEPDPADAFGLTLGNIAARGERGALIVPLDALLRMSSNPFYPYMAGRIMALTGDAGGK